MRIPALLPLLLALLLPLPFALQAPAQGSPDWQQRVQYEMDITLHPDTHLMEGFQRLTYHNNAPDTLRRVFYHLYFNAFQPTSMMAERNRRLPDPDPRIVPRIFRLGPDEVGFYDVHTLTQNGVPVPFRIDDTVMEVALAEPIPPGGEAVFRMRFRAQVPLQTRRSGRDNREGIAYSMTQWYPKIAQYDERGWHPDPYVGREFYAPFGTFDVRLRLPAPFVVGATGVLQNPEAVGHGYGASEGTDGRTYSPSDTLLWHFYAEDVHDFAWVADPDFVHDHVEMEDGTDIHVLYQPDVAEAWSQLTTWVPRLMRYYNEHYGAYLWPQFTIAQGGDGGMEYPMITLISGYSRPNYDVPRTFGSLLSTTTHELAHLWYHGILGINEADYAWMDEGFANYTQAEALAHVLGRGPANHLGTRIAVIHAQRLGYFEPLNTPADWFTTNAAYGTAAYAGGQMLVDLMGYVISPPLRDAWLKAYYEQFKLRHPNRYDVEAVAEAVSGLRLDWYFEQFTQTAHPVDYAVADLDRTRAADGTHTTEITLRREGEAVLPIDLRLRLADGSSQWVNIPLGIMEGHKPVPPDWIVAEPWFWTFPTYTLQVQTPSPVVAAEIDPMGQMPDRNRLNNTSGFPVEASFLEAPQASWFYYSIGYRPLAQYADDFGFGAGAQARGTYIFDQHRIEAMVKLWPEVLFDGPERIDGVDYEFLYADDLPVLGRLATGAVRARKHLGFLENVLTVEKAFGPWTELGRSTSRLTARLLYQYGTSPRAFEIEGFPLRGHTASAQLDYRVGQGRDHITAGVEFGSAIGDEAGSCLDAGGSLTPCPRRSATRAYLEAAKTARIGSLLGRAHVKAGVGTQDLVPYKQFRLGAVSLEESWRSDAFRTLAAVVEDEDHLRAFGEPGPVAYPIPGVAPGGRTTMGANVLAGSLSLATGPLVRGAWLRPLRAEAFSGFGQTRGTNEFLADAGLGLSYEVAAVPGLRRWAAQSDVLSGLHLVARFPLWVSHPDFLGADEDAFAFRWLLGVQVGR